MNFSDIFHYRPTLSQEKKKVFEEEISEQAVILAMKSFGNNKSPGKDGLTKEFYKTFWEDLKQSFMNSLNQAKVRKKWSNPKGKQ